MAIFETNSSGIENLQIFTKSTKFCGQNIFISELL